MDSRSSRRRAAPGVSASTARTSIRRAGAGRKGERAFYILAPCRARARKDDRLRGARADAHRAGDDLERAGDGDEGDRGILVGFRDVAVFGYSQTEGEPLPHEGREKAFLDALPLVEVGGAILLECIGEPVASDRGGAFSYLEAHCQRANADLFATCAALIDRTCNAVALILESAAQLAASAEVRRSA